MNVYNLDEELIRQAKNLTEHEVHERLLREMGDPQVGRVEIIKERRIQDPVVPKFSNKRKKRK